MVGWTFFTTRQPFVGNSIVRAKDVVEVVSLVAQLEAAGCAGAYRSLIDFPAYHRSRIAGGISSTPIAAAQLVSFLLKLLPLVRRKNFLQTFVSLPANLANSWLRFLSKSLELRPGVTHNLVDLRLLVGIEL